MLHLTLNIWKKKKILSKNGNRNGSFNYVQKRRKNPFKCPSWKSEFFPLQTHLPYSSSLFLSAASKVGHVSQSRYIVNQLSISQFFSARLARRDLLLAPFRWLPVRTHGSTGMENPLLRPQQRGEEGAKSRSTVGHAGNG